ncbi:MAG: hypothetical protein ACREXT_04005, partial [Gammaproteobacteria bacterium]
MDHIKPIDTILAAFPDATKKGREWIARCPAHNPDKRPSLHFREGDDGTVLLKCRSAGCSAQAITEAVGLTLADLFVKDAGRNGHATKRTATGKAKKIHATVDEAIHAAQFSVGKSCTVGGQWTYHTADGSECFRVVRFNTGPDQKEFRPIHRVTGGWAIGDPPGKLPLYRLPDIADVEFVVEGEKCADAATAIGLPATTSAHGWGSPHKTDWTPLRGREIHILPDNDPGGAKYANAVPDILRKLQCTVKSVALPGLGKGGDIADFIAQHREAGASDEAIREEIEALCEATVEYKAAVPHADTRDDAPHEKQTIRFTELWNAERLVELHGQDIRYCPSHGWFAWDGKRWARDEGEIEVRRRAKATLRHLYREA